MIAREPQPLVGNRDAYVVSDVSGYRDERGYEIAPRRIARRPAIRVVAEPTNGQEMHAQIVERVQRVARRVRRAVRHRWAFETDTPYALEIVFGLLFSVAAIVAGNVWLAARTLPGVGQ